MSTAQSDIFIGPIIAELKVIAQQIDGIGTVYEKMPEGPPEDNSVMFACQHIGVNSVTNGYIELTLEFDIIHSFRRVNLTQDLSRCYAAMPAWATVLSTPANVRMNNVAQLQDLTDMDIQSIVHGGQKMIGVISHIRVKRQFTIP